MYFKLTDIIINTSFTQQQNDLRLQSNVGRTLKSKMKKKCMFKIKNALLNVNLNKRENKE